MKDEIKEALDSSGASWKQATNTIEKLFDVTQPGAVFSEPVAAEGSTIITASEVMVGMGIGYGMGGGSSSGTGNGEELVDEAAGEANSEAGDTAEVEIPAGEGFGGGGGGGGFSTGRPVAAIIVDPDGVRVEPIFDVTKVALAFFTMLGSVFFMGMKMRSAANRFK